jgi:hypothetical protein
MKSVIKVALLINDTPVSSSYPFETRADASQVPEVVARHGDYLEIYTRHLQDSLQSYPDESVRGVELVIDGYEVRDGKYPEDVGAYDAVMMTGSGECECQRRSRMRGDDER